MSKADTFKILVLAILFGCLVAWRHRSKLKNSPISVVLLTLASVAGLLFLSSLYRARQVASLDPKLVSLSSMISAGDGAGVYRLLAANPPLIEAHLNCPRKGWWMTPLSVAASLGQEMICSNLVAAGANVNARDEFGRTPLHNAVSAQDTNVVVMLLQHGADVTLRNVNGGTPLDFARRTTANEGLKKLLADAMVNATSR